MRFRKSEGLNASEKLLAELCEQSLLKLWTYPNLYRKPGKELTDLRVVFGNDVIIFSAKACSYPNSGYPAIDWSRWFRSSIADSAKQIAKAEKSIQAAPDKVFLDAKCLEKLPIALPPAGDMRVHRICVALGALVSAAAMTWFHTATAKRATKKLTNKTKITDEQDNARKSEYAKYKPSLLLLARAAALHRALVNRGASASRPSGFDPLRNGA